MSGFEEAIELRSQLEFQYGEPGRYVPPPDGAVSADRMEVFLQIREATQATRLEIARTFESFPMTEEEGEELEQQPGLEIARRVFGMIGSGLGLGAQIGRFMESRNRALLENGMGMGEYTYIYVVAYHSWLGHSIGEGPHSRSKVKLDLPTVRGELRRRIVQIFQNQLDAAGPEANPVLARQLELLRDSRNPVPYADGLPPALEASLKPYRDRLEATYNPVANQFELSLNRRRGRFGIQSE